MNNFVSSFEKLNRNWRTEIIDRILNCTSVLKSVLLILKSYIVLVKIKLKNSDDSVTIDDHVFEFLTKDPYFAQVKIADNLRKHSSGCAVFQKTWKNPSGEGYKTETLYLHKLLAERFLADQKTAGKNLVGTKNGDKLDCRLENISWRSRAVASRQRRTSNHIGYTGVYKENHRYRAVISANKKSMHLGMYDTAEEAAEAYNRKSRELFGDEGKQNIILRP